MEVLDPTGGGPDTRGPIGVDYVAYTYASLTDLFQHYADLKANHLTPYGWIHHGITSMYDGDPDDDQMEFLVDCFADSEEANAFMCRSFAVNPWGVEFDPDAWLADLQSGTPADDVLPARSTWLSRHPQRALAALRRTGRVLGYLRRAGGSRWVLWAQPVVRGRRRSHVPP